ncbi:MAG: efflux transporter outer membrane subunit [Candidatus Sulfopaludibacter sp.]|nr:efflux transporter outer membrane subunit [Candidatus Sulfopaludibacter sp.]
MKIKLGGAGVLACLLAASGCMVGPNYKRPPALVPVAYKEPPTDQYKEANGWKPASPSDELIKGKWWEIYNDPALNALEEQVAVSNQNVLALEAQYREARAATLVARAALYPTVGTSPSFAESRAGGSTTANGAAVISTLRTATTFPLSASWAPDLWGSVRRNITAASATAQATAAQLENARLLYQSELAQDYFQLHGLDSQYDLLSTTVQSYQEYLTLTRNRFAGGVASDLDVAQAESQVYTTQSEMQDLGVLRAQYEHAIAVLTGRPPAELTIASLVLRNPPPSVPINVPSALLERRPDIAASERQMAVANEQIGIAVSAYYPSLTLSASVGLENSSFLKWFTWPSRFFSVGPAVSETIFDAGRRRAVLTETQAGFDITIANYRQTVLTAFQQVEDNLAALRVMEDESATVARSVDSSNRALTVSTAQYKAGTTSYLTVITAQATALSAERTAVDLLTRRLVSSVALVQSLGGGWDASQLPTIKDVQTKTR